ncbi:hypothetical protein IRJ41_019936, partial [Triplophysa rosa]
QTPPLHVHTNHVNEEEEEEDVKISRTSIHLLILEDLRRVTSQSFSGIWLG